MDTKTNKPKEELIAESKAAEQSFFTNLYNKLASLKQNIQKYIDNSKLKEVSDSLDAHYNRIGRTTLLPGPAGISKERRRFKIGGQMK